MYDSDIRAAFKEQLASTKAASNGATVVDEMCVIQCSARIDIALISDTLRGFEIKSDYDTLTRLQGQHEAYNKVFDEITVIATSKHIPTLPDLIDEHWGIIEASAFKTKPGIRFRRVRQARKNPNIIGSDVAKLLWRDELADELKKYGFSRVSSRTRHELSQELADYLCLRELQQTVCKHLTNRPAWRQAGLSCDSTKDHH
jgi:hypothetical protein